MTLPPPYEIDSHAVASELREDMTKTEAVSDERLEKIASHIEEWGETMQSQTVDIGSALRELQRRRFLDNGVKRKHSNTCGCGYCT